jgi:hypothetical protein
MIEVRKHKGGFMSVQIEIKSLLEVFMTLDKEVAEKIGHRGWCLNDPGYVDAHFPDSGRLGKNVQFHPQ